MPTKSFINSLILKKPLFEPEFVIFFSPFHMSILIDLEIMKLGGFPAADMTGELWAPNVKLPVLMWQVKDDAVIENPWAAQRVFDLLGSTDKKLIWIENTTKRFEDGYNWFGRHPEKVVSFLDKYMK